MQVTVEMLIAAGIGPTQAKVYAKPLAESCAAQGIDTPKRLAAFLAQVGHESLGLTQVEECLYYRNPERIRAMWPTRVPTLQAAAALVNNPRALANVVYANRLGNGDAASGDGWAYRGRGLIQITGRANYRKATPGAWADYEHHPELVALPTHACLTAAWYWSTNGCNVLADAGDIDGITRVINGPAMAGRQDRAERYERALEALESMK